MKKAIVAIIIFFLLCSGVFLLLNCSRHEQETILDAIAASVPIWAIFLTILAAFLTHLQGLVERKESRKREAGRRREVFLIFISELASFRGSVDAQIVGWKTNKPFEGVPSFIRDRYRPCKKLVEKNPEDFDAVALSIIGTYESLLEGDLKRLDETANEGSLQVQRVAALSCSDQLSRRLKAYEEKLLNKDKLVEKVFREFVNKVEPTRTEI